MKNDKNHSAPEVCDGCEEQTAIVRVSVTTLDGTVLDSQVLCRDCWKSSYKLTSLSIGD